MAYFQLQKNQILMLLAKDIHHCIGKRPIVDQISLEVQPGEILAILGPNGAGKSTLFKLLSGEVVCKRGMVSYNQFEVGDLKASELAKIRAVLPQHSQVNFPFTVREVVTLGLHQVKVSRHQAILEEVMEMTQIGKFADKLYHQLSGGEQQRVQLSRVLVQIWESQPYPRYLLLDEPTSSLDIAQQHAVLRIIKKLTTRNIGVVIILHELNLAAQYADKIALLKNGILKKWGTVPEIMDEQLLEMVFDHPVLLIPYPACAAGCFVASAGNISSANQSINQV
jgi:iron complex transport system ATP-binding protein